MVSPVPDWSNAFKNNPCVSMMTPEGFEQTVKLLIKRGYTLEQAEDYAACIGDVIEVAPDGQWIVRDESGKIIDRIDPLSDDAD